MTYPPPVRPASAASPWSSALPGLALASAVAVAAVLAEPGLRVLLLWLGKATPGLPAMVIALIFGVLLHPIARAARFEAGLTFAVKTLLRVAIGLLGLKIAFSDLVALGGGALGLVIVSMALTLISGFWFVRLLGGTPGYGALAGAATAICGASAALATSSVVPAYRTKEVDTAFTVIMANIASTLVMLAYPPLCLALGLSSNETGILLGATIHDMAQVVGAGYALSEPIGNAAVIVKLFRIFLLLPVVMAIGWWFTRGGTEEGPAKKPAVPLFALAFLALATLNSLMPALPAAMPLYVPLKAAFSEVSRWGLLIAIAALGLGTSIGGLMSIGWRHIAVFCGTSLVLLISVLAGLMLLR